MVRDEPNAPVFHSSIITPTSSPLECNILFAKIIYYSACL